MQYPSGALVSDSINNKVFFSFRFVVDPLNSTHTHIVHILNKPNYRDINNNITACRDYMRLFFGTLKIIIIGDDNRPLSNQLKFMHESSSIKNQKDKKKWPFIYIISFHHHRFNKTKMMMINMTASYTIFFIWPHDIPCWNINSFELSIIDCLQTVYCYTDISVSFVQKNISIRTEFRLCHNMAQNHFLHDRTLIIFCFVDFGCFFCWFCFDRTGVIFRANFHYVTNFRTESLE